ncbi:hypothetical protein [uncultured Arcticibacterium sp.]|uniref:hypothetical protein n=1 Tax=uncultured Arcticibacterium sp. TaxID=2173042 RepID=UPI0030F99F67
MNRKEFIQRSTLAAIGLSFPLIGCNSQTDESNSLAFKKLAEDLLKEWCDGMIKHQVNNPSDAKVHGMLECPACETIHGRSMDAVYPFFHMATATGEKKYLDAGIAALEWAEIVTLPDGSWTNTLDPKSWNGITIFGAIALAEALHYHGNLLDDVRREKWMERLQHAAEFIYEKFTISFTNINYPATAVYGLNLIGRVLKNDTYIARSKEFAEEVKAFFTTPNYLLYGEGKPSDKLSEKGLNAVDLGYNVEESLNSLVMYALHENDEDLLTLLTKSLNGHLEFMLPDGGWDNSWGTRQFKWTYWGSRTADGCQPAFGMMAHKNPAFGTAAVKNTELLKRCTTDGLLHGGIHYVSHRIKPCIHHTFAHAKNLAAMLDRWDELPEINTRTPLPRTLANGVKHFPELDTSLFARGNWRGTVTAYDAIYKDGHYRQATGGALSVLYHNKVGLLVAASMAIYKLVEVYNQQPNPGEDFALTPRVETFKDEVWYSNIFDRAATIKTEDVNNEIKLNAISQLKNESNEVIKGTASDFELSYECSEDSLSISAKTRQNIKEQTAFVLPIISQNGEAVKQPNASLITIQKPEGLVSIKSSVPLKIKETPKGRTFNMVPGMEAVPIIAYFEQGTKELTIAIEVS